MLLDSIDITILKFIGWCKDIAVNFNEAFSSDMFSQENIQLLLLFKYIHVSNNGMTYRLTSKGYDLLDSIGINLCRNKYCIKKDTNKLFRRMGLSGIAGLIYLAGGDIFSQDVYSLDTNRNLYVSSLAIRGDSMRGKVLGSTRFAGLYRSNDTIYVPYLIKSDGLGLNVSNENSTISALIVHIEGYNKLAGIFAGESYEGILCDIYRSKDNGNKNGTLSYLKALNKFDMPVYIVLANADGVTQLKIINTPNYIKKLSFLHNTDNPMLEGTDGDYEETPTVICIDMDIKRIIKMAKLERSRGMTLTVCCLELQASAVDLLQEFARIDLRIIVVSDMNLLCKILNITSCIRTIPHETYTTEDRKVIHAIIN